MAEVKEAETKTAAAVDAMEAADTGGRAYYYTAQRTIIVTLTIVESLP